MTYWQQMSILLWFWPARGIGAADERLGEVQARHHQLHVGGIAWLVSSEMTIMTTNAGGTVQTAGWPSSAAPQPCAAAPSIVATIAQKQAPPPTSAE